MSSTSSNSQSNSVSEPSLLSGHLQYVKGSLLETVGIEQGTEAKQQGIEEMRAAKDHSDQTPATQPDATTTFGSIENKLGHVIGCEGMIDPRESQGNDDSTKSLETQADNGTKAEAESDLKQIERQEIDA